MAEILSEIVLCGRSIINHMVVGLTGGIIIAVFMALGWWLERVFPWRLMRWILAYILLTAFFYAWQDEYHKAQNLSHDNTGLKAINSEMDKKYKEMKQEYEKRIVVLDEKHDKRITEIQQEHNKNIEEIRLVGESKINTKIDWVRIFSRNDSNILDIVFVVSLRNIGRPSAVEG